MAEPSVQVPVSLIGDALDAIRSGHDPALWPDVVQALDALLSQPTPTAEPERDDWNAPTGAPWNTALRPPAAPPNITDMAPGTTFTAEGVGVPGTLHRFTVTDQRDPAGHRYLRCATHDGNGAIESYVDPSTIRDVTPPKEQS